MAATDDLRVGDTEREAVAEQLREHFAAGRLTVEEFDERLGAAYKAKTGGDLAKLTRDLPRPSPPAAQPAAQWAPRRGYGWRWPFPFRMGAIVLALWLLGSVAFGGWGHGGLGWGWPFIFGRVFLVVIVLGVVRGIFGRRRGPRRQWRGPGPGPGPNGPNQRF